MKSQSLPKDCKNRILSVAYRLFYDQGYHATGINQVIAEAGVAKASFYQHFSSKEELCIACLEKRHQDWFSQLQEEIEKHKDARERLLSLFTFLEQWLSRTKCRGCAFLNIASEFPSPESPVRVLVLNHKKALQAYIKGLVSQLEGLKDENSKIWITELIYLLFEGAINKSQVYGSSEFLGSVRESVEKFLINS